MEQEGEDEGEDPIQPYHSDHSAEMEQEDSVLNVDTEVVIEDNPFSIGRFSKY